ncbi:MULTISPECIES: hypothetical protein [Chryseobacterium]|uniref:Uncharacterized protein n=1 Tax=Chryseobacterium salivictor TaxID=2547600 RepID=A0A4P6ZI50_9FLAO|nr:MULTISPECIES: hypothetical protein [Chryseobacterium]MDQ0475864.1 hypothetical protein [Chryseobacterium sp. MDT2-18]QBO59292.1 hypothetical protein NBC122_02488 [Chryseobacterium salivictor]
MKNKDKDTDKKDSRIIKIPGIDDRVIRNESDKKDEIIINDRPLQAENAVPPKAWKNQEKAYGDAWEKNKNQMLDDDL